jgi:hypothetical protein
MEFNSNETNGALVKTCLYSYIVILLINRSADLQYSILLSCYSYIYIYISTHRGSEFQSVVKQIPSFVPRQSTGLRLSPDHGRSHMGFDVAVYGWVEVREFSRPV